MILISRRAALAALASLGFALATSPRAEAAPVTYTVIMSGEKAGQEVITPQADGSLKVSFSYRNNGRGPDYEQVMRFAADNTLEAFSVKGKTTFGSPVSERYTRKGSKATWKALSESGSSTQAAGALYVPVDSSFAVLAASARALLAAPGNTLPALPGGQLTIKEVTRHTFTTGPAPVEAVLYAMTGLDLEPSWLWLRADDSRSLFAFSVPGNFQLVPAGFEAIIPELDAEQLKAEDARNLAVARQLAHPPKGPVLLRNVRVFDSENARLLPAQDVYVSDGRIAAVVPTGQLGVGAEPGSVVDGKGRVLLPGLFEMHGHVGAGSNALLHLAGGVTTVRDLGADNATLADLKAKIAAGTALGPHIVANGFIEGRSPYSARGGFVVDSLEAGQKAVDWYAARGYHQLKFYNSMKPEWVGPLAKYAHDRGLKVGGHVPAFMKAEDAVNAGYDELHHINQVLLNFLVQPGDDTRTLVRFYRVADGAAKLDLKSKPVQDFIALLKKQGTVIDPTLTIHENSYAHEAGTVSASYAAVYDNVPVNLQRGWKATMLDTTGPRLPRYRASYAQLEAFVGELYRAGVTIVAGTDSIGGFSLHRELEIYVRAGIPANEVLRMATWTAARVTQTLPETGSITPGKRADLVLVEGNPLENISAMRNVALVLKEGVAYYPSELYESMGIKPFAAPAKVE